MTREPPKRYSDRLEIVEDNSQLIIKIKTEADPDSYSIYEIYIFGAREEDQIILNSEAGYIKKNGSELILTISNFTKKFEITEVGVMLSRKGKQEYYSMSKKSAENPSTQNTLKNES